jgi:hypothetical protein
VLARAPKLLLARPFLYFTEPLQVSRFQPGAHNYLAKAAVGWRVGCAASTGYFFYFIDLRAV